MYRALGLANRTDSLGSTGVRDAAGQSGRFAGQQLEASASYWLMPKVAQLEVGYARLFKGRCLRVATNAPDTGATNYGYASILFHFCAELARPQHVEADRGRALRAGDGGAQRRHPAAPPSSAGRHVGHGCDGTERERRTT